MNSIARAFPIARIAFVPIRRRGTIRLARQSVMRRPEQLPGFCGFSPHAPAQLHFPIMFERMALGLLQFQRIFPAGSFRSIRTFGSLPHIAERRIHDVRFVFRGRMSRRPSHRREAMSRGAFGASSFVIRDRPSLARQPAPRSPLLDGRVPHGRFSGVRDKPFRSLGLRRRARRSAVLVARFLVHREFGEPVVMHQAVRASRPARSEGPDDGMDQFSQRFLRR